MGFLDNVFGKRETPQAPAAQTIDWNKLNADVNKNAGTNIQAGRDLSTQFDPGAVEARKRYEQFVLEDDARGGLMPQQIADSVRRTLQTSGQAGIVGSTADLFENAQNLGLSEWDVLNQRKNRLKEYGFVIQPERTTGISKDDVVSIVGENTAARNAAALQQWQVNAANATTPTFLEGLAQGAITRGVNTGFNQAEGIASNI
jgi:hypothetical protein